MQEADPVGCDLRQGGHDVRGDEVASPGAGGQGEGFLRPGHLFFWSWGEAVGWAGRRGGGVEGSRGAEGVQGQLEEIEECAGEEGEDEDAQEEELVDW